MARKFFYFLLVGLLFCQNKLPNDVRWVTDSVEYKSLCHQIYLVATEKLEKIDKKSKNNLAIIMDLDETVLDNSQYQIDLYEKNDTYTPKTWAKWVIKEEAKLVPGVKDFIDKVRLSDIQLIFISNRMNERLLATKNNMKKCSIFSDDDIYLLRLDKSDKKHIRRDEIYNATGRMSNYSKFDIILYLGDAMGDFPTSDFHEFGKSQFIFPNPMYGKW